MRKFLVVIQMREKFIPGQYFVNWKGIRYKMQRVILEIHDALTIFCFKVGLMDDVAFGHIPGPDRLERLVGLDLVVRVFGQIRANDIESSIGPV